MSPAVDVDPAAALMSLPIDAPIPLMVKEQAAVDKDVVKGISLLGA